MTCQSCEWLRLVPVEKGEGMQKEKQLNRLIDKQISRLILSRDDVVLRIRKSKTVEEAVGWQMELRELNAKLGLDVGNRHRQDSASWWECPT